MATTVHLTRVQHTCVKIESELGAIVIDPALDYYNNMWSPRGRSADATLALKSVKAALITHAHSDHFHPPTLLHFERDLPIVLPAADSSSPFPMAEELKELGFTNIRPLSHGESTAINGIVIRAYAAPDSIETLPQSMYIVEFDGVRILHAADALEGFLDEDDVLSGTQGCDVALMPMNVSLNAANLRNQMSPATFAATVDRLEPRIVVPLGTNEGQRLPSSPTSAPWFPFGEPHLSSRSFLDLLPNADVVTMRDGELLTVQPSGKHEVHKPAPAEADQAVVETSLGRLWSLVCDVHVRSRAAFDLHAELTFNTWRERWCDVTATLADSLVSGSSVIDDAVTAVPVALSVTPPSRIFPRSLALAELASPGVHARTLWHLTSETDEPSLAQRTYDVLLQEIREPPDKWLLTVEFAGFLQRLHLSTRPPDPRPWSKERSAEWWSRQIRNDLGAAQYVFPTFNPVFGPFTHEGQTVFLSCRQREDGRMQMALGKIPEQLRACANAITRGDADASLAELIASDEMTRADYEDFATWLCAFEPYALDTHWLRGHRWSWAPTYAAEHTERNSK